MKIPVNIYDKKYVISGDADQDYIREIAEFVDTRMREINKLTNEIDSTKIAILTALNIADEFFQLKKSTEETASAHVEENYGEFEIKIKELTEKLDRGLRGTFPGTETGENQ